MKHKRLLFFIIIVLTGVSLNVDEVFASTYPSSIAWNNSLYGLSAEEVNSKDVGIEIGKIKRQRTPMPIKNGESNEKQYVGNSLFEIKGVDIEDAIAVEIDDKFFKASPVGPLQEQSNDKTWITTLSIIGLMILFTVIIIRRKRRHIG
jgi:hypothetical protein